MRMIVRSLFVLAVGLAGCGAEDPGAGSAASVSESISVEASHACPGLEKAYANCPDANACAVLRYELVKHGCNPSCPCTEAPVHTTGSYTCATNSGSLTLCSNGVACYGLSSTTSATTICDACRQQYGIVCYLE